MYICCALVGAIEDLVSQNARCNSEKMKSTHVFFAVLPYIIGFNVHLLLLQI
jgi:hypothetical protein